MPSGSGRVREKTPVSPRACQSGRLGHALGTLAGPHALEGEPPGDHRADALSQLALVVADAEVHQRALGRPRMRSATMLRWICDVPAAMVSEIDLNQLCTCSALSSGCAVEPDERVGAQPGAVEHLHAEVAQRLRVLGEGELEHGAADAGDAGLGRLGDVALGQGPQRVEGGPQVPEAPGQALVAQQPEPVGHGAQLAEQAHALEQLAHEGGAALEGQGDHGDPPPVVLVAHPVGHRDAHLVEEELGELGRARDGAQRPDLDSRASPWAG